MHINSKYLQPEKYIFVNTGESAVDVSGVIAVDDK